MMKMVGPLYLKGNSTIFETAYIFMEESTRRER